MAQKKNTNVSLFDTGYKFLDVIKSINQHEYGGKICILSPLAVLMVFIYSWLRNMSLR